MEMDYYSFLYRFLDYDGYRWSCHVGYIVTLKADFAGS